MAYLEVKNINKNFGKYEILKGINFSLEKGQVLSIIGSSGSGKTTLLRCLNFLETPDEGEMILDGNIILKQSKGKKYTDKELREKRLNFGLVFQNFNLFPQYSVLNNVSLAEILQIKDNLKKYNLQLKQKGVKYIYRRKNLIEYKKTEKEKIFNNSMELLKKVGLLDKANFYPCQLSGGGQQRVAIARALALKPKILCFDEPTSALDPELSGEVLKVIRSLKSENITMIIVTHEMGFAKNVSDKVIYMSEGKIEEEGTPDEIFDNPKSFKLKNFLSNIDDKEKT